MSIGGNGNDMLFGDGGSDRLMGDFRVDTFVLGLGGGIDVIVDFENRIDRIGLPEGISFANLTIEGDVSDVTIRSGNEILTTVLSVVPEAIDAPDFITVST